jgi:hypothetical protein
MLLALGSWLLALGSWPLALGSWLFLAALDFCFRQEREQASGLQSRP